MAIVNRELDVYHGNTYTFEITVTEWDGSVFDLTGFTATFRALIVDLDPVITVVQVCDTNPLLGKFEITLPSDETQVTAKTYDYDVQIANTDSPAIVYTVAKGKLNILKDATI